MRCGGSSGEPDESCRRAAPTTRVISGCPGSGSFDDPVPRKSHHSYFTQMADLVAYAGYRHAIPPREGAVCPQAMWGALGQATRREVNSLTGRSDGVVVG